MVSEDLEVMKSQLYVVNKMLITNTCLKAEFILRNTGLILKIGKVQHALPT